MVVQINDVGMVARELRIGNLVIDHLGNPYKIKASSIVAQLQFELAEQVGYRPITLTEEILLKCGFEKLLNGFHINISIDQELSINIITNECYLFRNDPIHGGIDFICANSVKYLHQLQNLYFSLTGEELNVIL